MQIQQLINFQMVAQLEHMHLAAEQLNISQSALSASISRLEEELGCRLFDRIGRNIKLNQYGKVFYPQAEIAVRAVHAAQESLSELKTEENNQVVVMSDPFFYLEDLARHIHCAAPQVTLKYVAPDQDQVEQAILQRKVDICRVFTQREIHSCNSVILNEYEPMMLLRKDHPLASCSSVSIAEFAHEAFAAYPVGCGRRDILDNVCRAAGFEPRITQEIRHCRDLAHAVSMGKEVALDARPKYNRCYEDYDLAMVPIVDACPTIKMKLFWPRGCREKASAKSVRQLILDFFGVQG